jgi:very-short-patch-repair endonuclease
LDGRKFVRQFPVGRYVTDFCCREARLVIEVDGSQHTDERDAARTRFLESRDYRVLRFWDTDVLKNTDGVMEVIRQALGRAS